MVDDKLLKLPPSVKEKSTKFLQPFFKSTGGIFKIIALRISRSYKLNTFWLDVSVENKRCRDLRIPKGSAARHPSVKLFNTKK